MRLFRGLLVLAMAAATAGAQPVSQRIGAGDTALLFGGADAEGGIGDWYLSNGVVQAIIDDAGPAPDLIGVLPPDQVPPIQSEVSPTGGTIIDLGLAGRDGDEIPQLLTVGGLSLDAFLRYDSVSAPSPGVVRASGKLVRPGSNPPSFCIDVVTDYSVVGTDPFVTLRSTAANQCGEHLVNAIGGFLDAVLWTQRGIVPFSGGGGTTSGLGFDHPVLDLTAPGLGAIEVLTFVGAPGMLRAADGVLDPANGTGSSELAYGMLPVRVEVDEDGPGGVLPTTLAANALFGVSSPLATAVGSIPVANDLAPGGTLTYERRVYVGATADVRAVSDPIITDLAGRLGFANGTLSGDLDAADSGDASASIVVTRLGRCESTPALSCKTSADCGGAACTDPVPITGFGPGGAVSQVRTPGSGVFDGVVVPQGDYEMVVTAFERDDVTVGPVTVGPGDTHVVFPPLSARGVFSFRVREKTKRRPTIPAKLVFKGVEGTPDPRFHYDLKAKLGDDDVPSDTFGGSQRGPDGSAFGQGNVLYTATGEGTILIRPGTYDVYASRGPEYGVVRRRVSVPAGDSGAGDFLLKRVIRTRDAIAADFHVHSGRSLDSSAPLIDRVVSFAAEGVEVMISTDHDKFLDYAPVIAGLGLGARLASIPGTEVTGSVPNPPAFPNSIGHINAWPMPVAKDLPRDGAIQDEFVAPNWVFKRLRDAGGPDTVIQYNHPRAGVSGLTSIGIFNSIGCGRCAAAIDTPCAADADCGPGGECTCVGFQPTRTLTMPPNDVLLDAGILGPGSLPNPAGIRNIDFDVVEIANGAKSGDFPAYRQMRDDWFALLAQGYLKPGTGVSDSHRVTVEHAGWARTYVLGVGDDPAALDVGTFDGRVRAGRMVVSAGPFVRATARSGRAKAGPGETLAARKRIRLKVDVTSPAWIPVEEVRVVTIGPGGVDVKRYDATTKPRVKPAPKNFQSSGGTARFRASVPLALSSDALVLVEAGAKLGDDPLAEPPSPEIVNVIEPGVVPLAFTNPILIDVGDDGFAPPGIAAARAGLPPGRMTGVTRADRTRAIARGEHFPFHGLRITPADIAAAQARVGR